MARQKIRGLAAPVTRFPNGFFSPKNALETAWGDLMILLFTRVGSRPMARDFGVGLQDILFEPEDQQDDESAIQTLIEEAVETWLPSVEIESIDLIDIDRPKVIGVKVGFTLVEDGQQTERLVRVGSDGTVRQINEQFLR